MSESQSFSQNQISEVRSTCWSFFADHTQDWAYFPSLFSKEECEKISKIGEEVGLKEAKYHANDEIKGADNYRKTEVSWINPSQETEWLYRKITDVVLALNASYFRFELFGLVESLQFSVYRSPGGKYDFHIDKSQGYNIRKLSFSILLSDSEEYENGDLEINTGLNIQKAPREQGTIIVFPSYVLHRVTEVTGGTRKSLVGWVTGPAFK